MEIIKIMGPFVIALVNFIGLIVLWRKDYLKAKKINQLEIVAQNIEALNLAMKASTDSINDIRRELGTGNHLTAFVKKHELEALRLQISSIQDINATLKEKYDDLIKSSNESLEHQKSVESRIIQQQKIKNSPKFKFAYGGLNGDKSGSYRIINNGGKAHLATITSNREDLIVVFEKGAVINTSENLAFTWASEEKLSLNEYYEFIITFTDEVGNSYEQKIEWKGKSGELQPPIENLTEK